MRVALGIEYAGTRFSGWQLQKGTTTVQGELELALETIAGHPVRVAAAGRTDSGVHALDQVVHFDTPVERPERAWVLGTNRHLPATVRVCWAQVVDGSFSARFSALSRTYRYQILDRKVISALWRGRVTASIKPLNESWMSDAASALLGEHDFSAYRAAACQSKTPMRRIDRISVKRQGQLVVIEVTANAFLHHMVRNIAGVLMKIGAGEAKPIWAKEVLEGRDRTLGGVTARPDGLYLLRVEYPKEYGLPEANPAATNECLIC